MKDKNHIIERAVYKHSSISNFIRVKEYMIVLVKNKKCLAQRFSNELGYTVNAMQFSLIQLDDTGNVISTRKISYEGLNIKPGSQFVPKKHIVLMNECVDYRIIFHKVISGNYRYTVKGNDLAVYYKQKVQRGTPIFSENDFSIERPYKRSSAKGAAVAAFGLLIMTLILVICIIGADSLKSKDDSSDSGDIYSSESGSNIC